MSDPEVLGALAAHLGANTIARCDCGCNSFKVLVKLGSTTEVNPEHKLVAIKCNQCGDEAPVPLDPPTKEDKFKMFDNKIIDPRDLQ